MMSEWLIHNFCCKSIIFEVFFILISEVYKEKRLLYIIGQKL